MKLTHLLIWIMICSILPLWGNQEELWQQAHASYQQGEKAKTYQERKQAFNRALFLYSSLEQEASPQADLNQALANTYFQLGEYAWAILYYQRALKETSDDASLQFDLKQAQDKLGIFEVDHTPWMKNFPSFLNPFAWIFGITLLTFFILSLAIWFPLSWIRKWAVSCLVLLALSLSYAAFIYYFTPLEGIIVKTTGIYRAPQENQSQLTSQPLLAGSKVQILQMAEDPNWLKIKDSKGIIGYIPVAHLRPI